MEDNDGEALVRDLCDKLDFTTATAVAIERFGPEVLGFLVGASRDVQIAEDAFSQYCEDVFRGLPRFEWRASFRTWSYMIARRALGARLREVRRARRAVPLSQAQVVLDAAIRVRTQTLPHIKTENKDSLARIRAELDPAENMLLILRVDRAMSWDDIARVTADEDLSESELKRRAAATRKRFSRLKAKLRDLMRQPGPTA